ncbi:MAG: dimethylmenaquinone methyltransferase [Bryobacterales bacterium]|nr:dimethylmenaquinone methyltransferase [Bryobacterales bacterium]
MMLCMLLTLAAVVVSICEGQMFHLTRVEMMEYTARNPYDRFDDGRPKVPEAVLERVKKITVDQAWEVLRAKGYVNQFAGGFLTTQEGKKLVGRALTAQYLPLRPDLEEVLAKKAQAAGMTTRQTQKVTDVLQAWDVPVVDLMNARPGHNFGGDNLHAAIWGHTRTGAVVEGTIRDLEGIVEIPSQVYYRKSHPAAVGNVSVIGLNIPVRIGPAIVMPGDVVLGDRSGVIFIPPHMVEEVLKGK